MRREARGARFRGNDHWKGLGPGGEGERRRELGGFAVEGEVDVAAAGFDLDFGDAHGLEVA